MITTHPYGTKRCIVLLSGGQDSTIALAWAKENFEEVAAITIDYGQRHRREIEAAATIANIYDVELHEIIQVPPEVLKGVSPLVNPNVDVEEPTGDDGEGTDPSFVPARNLLFATIAVNRAVLYETPNIVMGACLEDQGGYPDCRPPFFEAVGHAANMSAPEGFPEFHIFLPLIAMTKAQALKMAADLPNVWFALAHSHTCYKGEFPPCGKCHACLLRAESFAQLMTEDPLLVRATMEEAQGPAEVATEAEPVEERPHATGITPLTDDEWAMLDRKFTHKVQQVSPEGSQIDLQVDEGEMEPEQVVTDPWGAALTLAQKLSKNIKIKEDMRIRLATFNEQKLGGKLTTQQIGKLVNQVLGNRDEGKE